MAATRHPPPYGVTFSGHGDSGIFFRPILFKVYLYLCANIFKDMKHTSKFRLLLVSAILCASSSFSQTHVLTLTKQSGGTAYLPESAVSKIVQTPAGSDIGYYDANGTYNVLSVLERTADTAQVNATIKLKFAGSAGSLDSILVNGVKINRSAVAYASSISATVGRMDDTINITTSTPNYTATASGDTLTITAGLGAFGDTANGYVVEVYTTTLTVAYITGTKMKGGFTAVNNILTHAQVLFNVDGGLTALNAYRVRTLTSAGSGTRIGYDSPRHDNTVSTTTGISTVVSEMNGL